MLRRDKTGFGDIVILQDTESFCYGIDAVLLADFAAKGAVSDDIRIMDMGTGTGIIPLILSHKLPRSSICAVELQTGQYMLAQENIRENGLSGRVRLINSNIKVLPDNLNSCFDMVTCNPPYVKLDSGMMSNNIEKMTARHETVATIDDFMKKAADLLDQKGEACFVYRPERLADIIMAGRIAGLEVCEMRPVHPYAEKPANLLLLRFRKGRKGSLRILPPLYVRNKDGSYSCEIEKIYER